MKKGILYGIWAALYLLCGVLSLIPHPASGQQIVMTILSVAFFVPGALLAANAIGSNDRRTLRILRWISAVSLSLTVAVFLANLATAGASELVGNVLYYILIFVSVPLISMGSQLLSLFLWACLLFATIWLPNRK